MRFNRYNFFWHRARSNLCDDAKQVNIPNWNTHESADLPDAICNSGNKRQSCRSLLGKRNADACATNIFNGSQICRFLRHRS